MFTTPMINIWNPICKKYQWLRIVHIFSISDNFKIYINDSRVFAVCMNENNQCECSNNSTNKVNKFLVVTESQVFRYYKGIAPNHWINKPKIFPEPELGLKNQYTNKYLGINMTDLYFKIKKTNPKSMSFEEPNINCCIKNDIDMK